MLSREGWVLSFNLFHKGIDNSLVLSALERVSLNESNVKIMLTVLLLTENARRDPLTI